MAPRREQLELGMRESERRFGFAVVLVVNLSVWLALGWLALSIIR
jgi:hypothetical protein